MFEIQLVAVGNVDRPVLEFLAAILADSLLRPVSIREGTVDPGDVYDLVRRQYHSTEILAKLVGLGAAPNQKILGVADVDLFIPILTFVFGEAQLGGPTALLSTYRLRQEFYGLPADEDLLYRRAEKEAIHELGHTFGLVHCRNFQCVMHYSNSIEQVDLKESAFCPDCHARWLLK